MLSRLFSSFCLNFVFDSDMRQMQQTVKTFSQMFAGGNHIAGVSSNLCLACVCPEGRRKSRDSKKFEINSVRDPRGTRGTGRLTRSLFSRIFNGPFYFHKRRSIEKREASIRKQKKYKKDEEEKKKPEPRELSSRQWRARILAPGRVRGKGSWGALTPIAENVNTLFWYNAGSEAARLTSRVPRLSLGSRPCDGGHT